MDATSIFLVAGARPNFMKVAPLYRALSSRPQFRVTIVHTGQHYDPELSDVFFRDLDLPAPQIALGVKAGTHGAQTGRVLERFEQELLTHRPDLVLVVGDVNSTVACALAAVKLQYPDGRWPQVAHVEAGLRSFDRTMPEEINRIVTDAVSDYLFTTERDAATNLRREGIPDDRIFFVGNVMIDTLRTQSRRARALRAWELWGLTAGTYAVVTVHRPSNVDAPASLRRMVQLLGAVSARLPTVFPAHPRTTRQLEKLHLMEELVRTDNLVVTGPLGYLEFLGLMSDARLVVTDSGGIQEETTVLGNSVPDPPRQHRAPHHAHRGNQSASGLGPRRGPRCGGRGASRHGTRAPRSRAVGRVGRRTHRHHARRPAAGCRAVRTSSSNRRDEDSVPVPLLPTGGQRAGDTDVRALPRVGASGSRGARHHVCPQPLRAACRSQDTGRGWYRRDTVDGVIRASGPDPPGAQYGCAAANAELPVLRAVGRLAWPAARARRRHRGPPRRSSSAPWAGCCLGALTRTPWVFEVRDLWPHAIRSVGAVRSSVALGMLETLELAMYRHAARVVCVARPFVDDLARRGVDPAKLVYVPNGVQPEAWDDGNRASTRAELGLGPDDVLVSYVGTVGMAHGLGTVLDAVRLLRDRYPSVRLLVVGDGAALPAIRDRVRAESLDNVTLTGLVPRARAQDYLAATDIALVVLKPSPMFELVLPSKMFEAMAAATPLVLGVAGEARRVLADSGGGVAVPPGDAVALADAVGRLAGDQVARARMGAAGRSFVTREFSRVVWAERYLSMLETFAQPQSEFPCHVQSVPHVPTDVHERGH